MIDTEKIPEQIFYKDKNGIDHFWEKNKFPKKKKKNTFPLIRARPLKGSLHRLRGIHASLDIV